MIKARAARLSWPVGDDRIVVYGDPQGHFAWKRTTKLGEALEGPHGPFSTISEATVAARLANPKSGKSVGPRNRR